MTDVIANVFVDAHPANAKLTLFRDGNRFLIASTVNAYFLQQMMLRFIADGSTRSSRNVSYDRRTSRFDIALDRFTAETCPNTQ